MFKFEEKNRVRSEDGSQSTTLGKRTITSIEKNVNELCKPGKLWFNTVTPTENLLALL